MAVFSIVIGAAVSLSHFQAKKGAGSTMRKMASESIALAIMQIRRDIARAGFGLLDDKEPGNPAVRMSLLVQEGASGAPDRLLLNFSDHIDMELDASKQSSFFGMFSEDRHGRSSSSKSWVWWSLINQNLLQMPSVKMSMDAAAIGGLITMTSAGTVGFKDSQTDGTSWKVIPVSGTQNFAAKTQTLQVQWSSNFTGKAVPAISYLLNLAPAPSSIVPLDPDTASDRVADYTRGQLLRNGVPLVGAGTADIDAATKKGRPPFIKVTDFQIRCGFYIDATHDFATYLTSPPGSNAGWTPDAATFGTGSYVPENLRALEITIRYIFRDRGGGNYYPYEVKTGTNPALDKFAINSARTPDNQNDKTAGPWAMGGTYTVVISPRTLVLGKQLGADPYGS